MKEIIICNTTNYGVMDMVSRELSAAASGAKLAGVREGMTAKERNGNGRR